MATDLPPKLSQPAQRALAGAGILNLADLARFTEREIKALHGIGPNALIQLQAAMTEKNLGFRPPRRASSR